MKSLGTVIIGGGQAGLATAYHLMRKNIDCIILDENEETGAAWRKRWDSLKLFTPGRYDGLPGMPYPGPPNSYPGKDEIADYLYAYAARFRIRVKHGVKVERVRADDGRYLIETTGGVYSANNVVVATGAFHHPRIPGFSESLEPGILQVHSSGYHTPEQVSDGPILVVGAGQSGAEISLDMARNGHLVWLSGRDPGEEPIVRGRLSGRILTPLVVFAARRVFNVANPLGRRMRKHFFYPPRGIPRAGGTGKLLKEAGVQCVGRTTGTNEGQPRLEDGRVLHVNTVIWCTGFVRDYSWIELPIFDEYGFPYHNQGVVDAHRGLYFIGMPFQRTMSSSLLFGVGQDARYIARHIAVRQPVDETRYRALSQKTIGEPVSQGD